MEQKDRTEDTENSGKSWSGVVPASSTAHRAFQPAQAPRQTRPFRVRRRDRHGRGLRGPLIPAALPAARTRSETFNDLVAGSAERLQDICGSDLDQVEFAIEEIPGDLEELVRLRLPVSLASARPARPGSPATVTVYRRPALQRSLDAQDLADLVHEAMVEQVAGLLNLSPEALDPGYSRG